MSVTYHENSETKTAEITVSGRVTREDFDEIAPKMEAFVNASGKIKFLEVIETLDGFDASLLWKGLKLDFRIIPHITHCAVVSDIGWFSPVSKAAGAVVSTKLRTFSMSEIDDARKWLDEAA